jgi:hypothetical protein
MRAKGTLSGMQSGFRMLSTPAPSDCTAFREGQEASKPGGGFQTTANITLFNSESEIEGLQPSRTAAP